MSIQMSFKKDGNNIKLESITDDGKTLDITKYSEPLLSIGKDGKYTRTSIEQSDTKESSNNDVNSNIEADNEDTIGTRKETDDLTSQELETSNTEQNIPDNMNALAEACKDLELAPGCEKDKTTYTTKYRVLARKYHPDRCKTPECEPMMKKINEANEKLNNYNFENSEPRVSENNEASNQEANTNPSAVENQTTQNTLSSVLSFANKLQNNTSNLLKNVPLPSQNNLLQVATIPKGGKTKRMKAGKKNKSKRVRFMSKRNRRR